MTAVTSKFETVLILMSVSHTCDYTHFNSIHKKISGTYTRQSPCVP